MKWIKRTAALFGMTIPVAAFALSSASGKVSHLYASAVYGDLIYVQLSTVNGPSGVPICSTGKAPYLFVLPRLYAAQADMFSLLLSAKKTGIPVILHGTGVCDADSTVETLGSVEYEGG